ncbi:Ribonuclease H-like superfamily [Sesbania bispinosa]|nr:Ribonuclease H-like superfamily [Sesbania bispinosa]
MGFGFRDFVDESHEWKIDVLCNLLPTDVIEEILANPCPRTQLGPDSITWGGTSHGAFSTRSAYDLIVSPGNDVSNSIWRAVWSWEGPQRAKCLLWMILNKGLKTRSKGFMPSNLCPLCSAHEETTLHIPRDCSLVRPVWGPLEAAVWPSRVDDLERQLSVDVPSRSLQHREALVRWMFPNPGWVKINVDGSVRQDQNRAGCGGVFRGVDGNWVLGFSVNMGRGSVLFAELRAVEVALKIA